MTIDQVNVLKYIELVKVQIEGKKDTSQVHHINNSVIQGEERAKFEPLTYATNPGQTDRASVNYMVVPCHVRPSVRPSVRPPVHPFGHTI